MGYEIALQSYGRVGRGQMGDEIGAGRLPRSMLAMTAKTHRLTRRARPTHQLSQHTTPFNRKMEQRRNCHEVDALRSLKKAVSEGERERGKKQFRPRLDWR